MEDDKDWIPACAGMTDQGMDSRLRGNDRSARGNDRWARTW